MVVVLQTFDVRASIAFELGLDPVDGLAITIRSLAPVAELRQPLDSGLVSLEIEPIDKNSYWIRYCFRLRLRSCPARGAGESI
jgi:hypothetical protein